jgi:uncharacterized protein
MTAPRAPWLLVGLSVRVLAQAAAAEGHSVCGIDAFGDRDTRAACAGRVETLHPGPEWRIEIEDLRFAVAAARQRFAPLGFAGIVTTGSLENRPALLDLLAQEAPLAGNGGEIVAAVREPRRWFELLRSLGAPHPEVSFTPPAGEGWLVKSAGGTGGWHVRRWGLGMAPQPNDYFQRFVSGRPASVLFAADGVRSRIIGWQWLFTDPTEATPWRYGGVMTAADLPFSVRREVADLVAAIAAEVPLRGLNGIDFLVHENRFSVLELNPRPTASVALHPWANPFSLHLLACVGRLPENLPEPPADHAAGEAVLYAPRALATPADFEWPAWCADLSVGPADFRRGDPVCSVTAIATSPRAVRRLLQRRLRHVLFDLENPRHASAARQRQFAFPAPGPVAFG